jgi:hypothetical protein|tara:strand:- start:6585 stop:6935 length:351 start_codon:yes stop_codon:yes gene_type:complete
MDRERKFESTVSLPDLSGGKGGLATGDRESLRIIKQAVTSGWDIPPEWKDSLPNLCMGIACDELRGDRERLRAIEILRAMQRDNLDAAQVLDKVERLDVGQATERIELGPIEWKPK